MGIFEMLAAGGDAATIAIVVILWRVDLRVKKLEWADEQRGKLIK